MAKPIHFKDLIIGENEDYIVINKPPFISTLEDRASDINILKLARDYHSDAQVCHRLDKDTSGVLVIARHPEAYRHMSLQLQNRTVAKVYHAVVDGIHHFKDLVVDAPIRKTASGGVSIDYRQGKEAVTMFTTLEVYRGHSLIECRPLTGRMHQIRLHLTSKGAPIMADSNYGGKPFFLSAIKRNFNIKKGEEEQPLIKRMPLHALELRFERPSGEAMLVTAPYPKDFRVLVTQLAKHS
jgi:RluA family pseudouridine synthase